MDALVPAGAGLTTPDIHHKIKSILNSKWIRKNINNNYFVHRQFIQERIRHLVEAFSDRTNLIRRRLEFPPTPSSLSSQDELEPPPLSNRPPKITETSESLPAIKDEKKINILLKLKYHFETKVIDPQSKFFVTWMFLVALAYMYNCWMIPFRATFPYQTPTNRPIWMFFDYFFDVVYILDLCLIQPRIMYISDGFWVSDYQLTKQHYMTSSYFKVSSSTKVQSSFEQWNLLTRVIQKEKTILVSEYPLTLSILL